MSGRILFRAFSACVCLVLFASSVPVAVAATSVAAVAARPDRVSAMSTAKMQGSRVEDVSQRTPTSATYANPDGSWTTQSYAGVIRAKGNADSWMPVDSTVSKQGGSYQPKSTPYDVAFSGGGDKTVGSVQTQSKATVDVGWPSKLPTPQVNGDTLTYPAAASDGSNLVVTSRPDGFDYSMVLAKAPTAGAAPVEYRVPLAFGGSDPVVQADGTIVLKSGRNSVAVMTAPVMWDGSAANKNGAGKRLPVTTTVEGTGDSRVLVLRPDMSFLQDPSTTYPVTVDPSLIVNTAGDTYVQSAGDTTSQYNSPELHIGSIDGGTTVARSYVYFDFSSVATIPNAVVTSAQVRLSNFETGSCTGSTVRMSRITSGWTIPSVNWATQPTVTTAGSTTSTDTHGATGCSSEGVMNFDATQMFTDWLGGAWNVGVQIKADDEVGAAGWRKVRSLENGDLSKVPEFIINYNTTPDVPPAAVAVTPGVTSGSTVATNDSTPMFSTPVNDPDGGTVTAEFQLLQGSTVVDDWTSGSVPSGSQVSRTLPSAVADGTYTAKWRVSDGTLTSAWSAGQTVVVDTIAPVAPTIACPSYSNATWYTTRPAASTNCTVTVSSDTLGITATENGSPVTFPALSSGSTSMTFNIATSDVFDLEVTAQDLAGNSVVKGFTFGTGNGTFTAPAVGAQSTETFPVNASAQSGATSAQIKWKVTGAQTAWIVATKVQKAGVNWTGNVTTSGAASVTGDLTWDAGAETGVTAPTTLDVQVCFTYPGAGGGTVLCTATTQVSLVKHAFGGSFPTSQVGPASVSLLTGEYQVNTTDVTVPGYNGALALSRTAQSFGTAVAPAQQVFGPGWIANLEGPDKGFAAAEIVDNTVSNGTIQLVGTDGQSTVYGIAAPFSAQKVGVYAPVGSTGTFADKVEIKNTSPKTLVLSESDGTVTTWQYISVNNWQVQSVATPSSAPATTFTFTGNYLTSILSGAPGATCTATTQTAGCHALFMTYTGTGTGTRLSEVDLRTWDPKPGIDGAPTAAAGMVTVPVKKYAYDGSGRLISAWDPRLDSGTNHVATTYTYQTANNLLFTVTPPGQQPWQFNLDASSRLDSVTRPQDTAVGGTATWKVKYGVPLSGTGLPTMTAATLATWGETLQVPTQAAAVFGPDSPTSFIDYTYANLSYFTAGGQTTNTVDYGAGLWQIDTTQYDALGQVSWTLDAANKALGFSYGWSASEISRDLTTKTTYSTDSTGKLIDDRIEQVVYPNATVVSSNGTTVYGRKRVRYMYDDEAAVSNPSLVPGRPTPVAGMPRANLPVQVISDLVEVTTGNTFDSKTTQYRYDPVVAGDGNGWTLHVPTRTSTSLGAGWSTTVNRFDSQGRTIETRTPQGGALASGVGNDARSTDMQYFTADASSPVAGCRNMPAWTDQVCQSGPAAASTAPVNTILGIDYLGGVTRSASQAGATIRTGVITRDGAGRPTSSSLSTVNAPAGEVATPDSAGTYSTTTGQLLTVAAGGKTSTNTYDTWGRVLTQTDGAGNTATTTYDSSGRTSTFNDGKGTYTYGYDGTDAAGKAERRGLVTSLNVGLVSGPSVFTAAYDNAGNQTKLVYPNGISADSVYDGVGNQITKVYSSPTGSAFMGFIQYSDVDGRVKTSLTPLSSDTYNYDDRGRLTQVNDQVYDQCTIRTYAYSLDSDRTSMTSYAPDSHGKCSTTTTATTTNGTFDGDSRKIDTGYAYDSMGRTATLPAADTVSPSDGNLNTTYYANDMVASLSQPSAVGGAQLKTYGLDEMGRISTMSSSTGGVVLRTTQNQYADSGDSPAWISQQTRPNASTGWTSTWSRNVITPGGGLGLIQSSDGTSQVELTNMHGDIVSTLPNTTGTFNGLANYSETTEYGTARTTTPVLGQAYTWLGGKRRSSDALDSLVLMGARLYNPSSGRFLSRDPVPGGNDNPYTYPVDPINKFDTSGCNTRNDDSGGAIPTPSPPPFILTLGLLDLNPSRHHGHPTRLLHQKPQSQRSTPTHNRRRGAHGSTGRAGQGGRIGPVPRDPWKDHAPPSGLEGTAGAEEACGGGSLVGLGAVSTLAGPFDITGIPEMAGLFGGCGVGMGLYVFGNSDLIGAAQDAGSW